MKVIIVDYKIGNYFSLINALKNCDVNFSVSNDASEIKKSDVLLLPGVGAFKSGMDNLKKLNLVDSIKEHAEKKKKILGICLGMQLLLDKSEEFGNESGLGLIEGSIKKLPAKNSLGKKNLIPNMSWNVIEKNNFSNNKKFLENINDNNFYYFVHSFYAKLSDNKNIAAFSNFYDFKFAAIINKNNIFGTQFHLEKSGIEGIKLLKKFFFI
tara:strand:+ start:400 stop:1032 length:633 start_codon:yes stop_codon:yes gene_type:complete